MKDRIHSCLQSSIDTKKSILNSETISSQIEEVSKLIIAKLKSGGTIYFAGNGGSAADAQHLSAELSGRFYIDREPLSAEALHCNTSFLTAVANDYSYDVIYARLLSGVGRAGDLIVGLSTSGNSKNIVKAFEQAKKMGIATVALTGEGGGNMKKDADICICVPSKDTPRIQESHITIGHIICELVENELFGKEK